MEDTFIVVGGDATATITSYYPMGIYDEIAEGRRIRRRGRTNDIRSRG